LQLSGFIDSQTAMGILPFGFGQVFFMGDTREVVFAQQPLTGNLIVHFLTIEGLMSQVLVADLDAHSESGLLKKLEAAFTLISIDRRVDVPACPGLPDLGGVSIETTEDEFLLCLDQIRNRCEELGIDPPDYP
jgi:hypothetical protein